jgi:outer membrane immunogenic protein
VDGKLGEAIMINTLLRVAALSVLVATGPAVAADMAVKAPILKAPPPVAYSWTGFYIGGNVGYSWGRGDTDFSEITGFTTVTQIFRTAGPTLVSTTTGTLPSVAGIGSNSANINGWLGGGQLGYNWQTGTWVFGLEADAQATGQRGDALVCLTAGCPIGGVFGSASYKMPWFATFRGRAGVTFDRWMLYATGGLAVAEIDSSFVGGLAGGVASALTANTTRAGWAVGGGVEGAITTNWTAKLEVLYMDYGSFDNGFGGITNTVVTNQLNTPAVGFNTVTTTTATTVGNFHSRVTDLVLRAGLNYRFGGPVVAKY